MGAGSGGRFVIDFSLEGPGEGQLKNVVGLLKQAGANVNTISKGTEKSGEGMMAMAAEVYLVQEALDKVGETGMHMVEAGVGIFEAWGKGFEVLLHKGSEMEQMLMRMQATGKTSEQARKMMGDAIEFTTKLPITESDAIRIMTTLATAHVDALKPIGESYEQLAAKGKTLKDLPTILGTERMKKEGPSAITVVGDMLAAVGHLGSSYQGMAIHELMEFIETGAARSPMTFGPLITEVRKMGHTAKTSADRVKGLQEILSKRGALGISQAAMATFGGIMSNFKGLIDKVTVAVMEPGKAGGIMSQLNMGFLELYNTVSKFFDEKTPEGHAFLGMLREVVSTVGGVLVEGMKKFGQILESVFKFMADNPRLMKFAALGSLVAGAFLVMAGGALVLTSVLLPLVAIFVSMIPLLVLLGTIGAAIAIPVFVALGVAIAGAFAAYQVWQMSGIGKVFQDVFIVVNALDELFKNMRGDIGSISEETAKKLEERGLMGAFLKISQAIRSAQIWWEGFSDALSSRWDHISNRFARSWQRISNALGRVGDAIGAIFRALFGHVDDVSDKFQESANSGEMWGNKVADVLETIGELAQIVAGWIEDNVPQTGVLIDKFASVYESVLNIVDGLSQVYDLGMTAFDGLATGASAAMAAIGPVVNMVWGLVKAAMAMSTGDVGGAFKAIAGGISSAIKSGEYWNKSASENAKATGEHASAYMERRGFEERNAAKANFLRASARDVANRPPPDRSVEQRAPSREFHEAEFPEDVPNARMGKAREAAATQMTLNQKLEGTVNLDGDKVGDLVWKKVEEKLERMGYHPT